MIRAIIIDDSAQARRLLASDIETSCSDVAIVGQASGVEDGIALIGRLRPDVVFLDIQLEDGSGFDLLARIGQYDFKVIFTTGSDAYGIRAVKSGAIDYLLKPIDADELAAAVEKVRAETARGDVGDRIEVILENLRNLHSGPKRIALNTADKVHIVNTVEIVRCESQRNYTLFHLTGGRRILVTRTLKEFDEMLEGSGFLRTHHSHLINMEFVREYVKGEGGYLVMTDGSEVPVAVRRKDLLLSTLGM